MDDTSNRSHEVDIIFCLSQVMWAEAPREAAWADNRNLCNSNLIQQIFRRKRGVKSFTSI